MFYLNNKAHHLAALLVGATEAAPRLVFMQVSAKMVGYVVLAVSPGSTPVGTPFTGLATHPSSGEEMKTLEKVTARNTQLDRRMSERWPFTATAEVTDSTANSRLSGRIADLSRGGCYVDLLNAIPVGSTVTVRIHHAQRQFQARGTVSYVLERMGMGIAFTDVSNESAIILEEWLGLRIPDKVEISDETRKSRSSRTAVSQREVLSHLINLLGKQRVITPDQAAELLTDLIGEE
jgi:hypothetical protein